jgi:hypothetical protein
MGNAKTKRLGPEHLSRLAGNTWREDSRRDAMVRIIALAKS